MFCVGGFSEDFGAKGGGFLLCWGGLIELGDWRCRVIALMVDVDGVLCC